MLLVDWEIEKLVNNRKIIIEPYDKNMLQPNSYDVKLGDHFIVYNKLPLEDNLIDPYDVQTIERYIDEYRGIENIVIKPGDFILARTIEFIRLPIDIAAKVDGKSSLARLGIVIHQTGGFIDAGFAGTITLEISNANVRPVRLYTGMPIAQIEFHQTNPARKPYNKKVNAKYQMQKDATLSRFFMNKRD